MSKLHEGNFCVTCGITKAWALIRNVESYLQLNTKKQVLLHLAETPLFSPEICAEVVWAGIYNALNNLSEMKVPSAQKQLELLLCKIFLYGIFGSPLFVVKLHLIFLQN